MKINITISEDKFISGYNNILLQNVALAMQDVVNNSCVEILANNVLDYIDQDQTGSFIKLLLSKLRIGGFLTVSGINLDIITRNLMNKTLSEAEFNNIIKNIISIHSRKYVVDMLKENNVSIQSSITKGHIYEIVTTRS